MTTNLWSMPSPSPGGRLFSTTPSADCRISSCSEDWFQPSKSETDKQLEHQHILAAPSSLRTGSYLPLQKYDTEMPPCVQKIKAQTP